MSTKNKLFFTLISPVCNEEQTIRELVERSIASFNSSGILKNRPWEYILVDDCSTDSSPLIISELISEYPDIVVGVRHKTRMGQGKALRTGFFLAKGEILATLDSDLEKLPEDTPKLLKEYIDKDCDIVCAYIKEKNLISKIGNGLLRFLFSYNAQQASTNQMVIGRQWTHRVNLVKNDQRYVLPIAMSLGAKKIGEVRTSYIPRKYGSSKYNILLKAFQGLPEMLSLKWRIHKNFYKMRLDDKYRKHFDSIHPEKGQNK